MAMSIFLFTQYKVQKYMCASDQFLLQFQSFIYMIIMWPRNEIHLNIFSIINIMVLYIREHVNIHVLICALSCWLACVLQKSVHYLGLLYFPSDICRGSNYVNKIIVWPFEFVLN
jgi:hypothetical protein